MLVGQPSMRDNRLDEDSQLVELELVVGKELERGSATVLQGGTLLSRSEVSAARCSSVRSVLQSAVHSVLSAPYSKWAPSARRV
eukprot:IDg19149t1